MQRFLFPAMLLLLLGLLAIPSFASSPRSSVITTGPKTGSVQPAPAIVAEIEQLLSVATAVPEGTRSEAFVTIITDRSNKRYAVIDFKYRPHDVTTQIPLVDWQKRFGLEFIQLVFPPEWADDVGPAQLAKTKQETRQWLAGLAIYVCQTALLICSQVVTYGVP